jgi:hypothetical protein
MDCGRCWAMKFPRRKRRGSFCTSSRTRRSIEERTGRRGHAVRPVRRKRGVEAALADDARCTDGPEANRIARAVAARPTEASSASDLLLPSETRSSRASFAGARPPSEGTTGRVDRCLATDACSGVAVLRMDYTERVSAGEENVGWKRQVAVNVDLNSSYPSKFASLVAPFYGSTPLHLFSGVHDHALTAHGPGPPRFRTDYGLTGPPPANLLNAAVCYSGISLKGKPGRVAERLMATGCKPVAPWSYGGSNPPPSTRIALKLGVDPL